MGRGVGSLATQPERVVGMTDEPTGVYVHVPFCATICPFCPYNKVVPSPGQPERYAEALLTEARRYVAAGAGASRARTAEAAGASGPPGFTSLYVGGGTPTLFPDLLARLVAELPVRGERAVEVLPAPGAPERLTGLRRTGFTAVSIGVQSFSDDVLRHLRRPHSARDARETLESAVAQFDLVDADLILDVEYDDARAGTFLRDLGRCFELGVDQVSTYPLMRFGFTPFGTAPHDRHREHEVLTAATRLAQEHGYVRRSVWTFNRPDSPSYTSITRRRFLGLGAGASSFLGRDFLVNHFGVETYIAAVAAGRLPLARWFHVGALGGLAYDAFWQAYAGSLRIPELTSGCGGPAGTVRAESTRGGRVQARAVRAAVGLLDAAGLIGGASADGSRALTPRGFDRFHDLERSVTYHLIEPLWAEMLAEHRQAGELVHDGELAHDGALGTNGRGGRTGGSRAGWAAPDAGRRGPLWRTLASVLERAD